MGEITPPGREELYGVGAGAEPFPDRPPQGVDPVDHLSGMVAQDVDCQVARPRVGVTAGLGKSRTGEEIAGALDQSLIEGHPEADVPARYVPHRREASPQRRFQAPSGLGSYVAHRQAFHLEQIEAHRICMEVASIRPGITTRPLASTTLAPSGGRPSIPTILPPAVWIG